MERIHSLWTRDCWYSQLAGGIQHSWELRELTCRSEGYLDPRPPGHAHFHVTPVMWSVSLVSSCLLKENWTCPTFNRNSPETKDVLLFAFSYLYLCCLITSGALFWECIYLALKSKSLPRSNSNLSPAHLPSCLLPWAQLSTKNLLGILVAFSYCDLWWLVLGIVSLCPKSKFYIVRQGISRSNAILPSTWKFVQFQTLARSPGSWIGPSSSVQCTF